MAESKPAFPNEDAVKVITVPRIGGKNGGRTLEVSTSSESCVKKRVRGNGRPVACIYCGRPGKTTKDHVVAKSLFRRPLPSNMVTVPACLECNREKGKLDEYFRDVLTADIVCSDNPVVKDIVTGPVRRWMGTRRSLLGRDFLTDGRFVPVQTAGGIYLGHHAAAPLDWNRVTSVCSMIVRGLHFHHTKRRFPDETSFRVLRESSPENVSRLIKRFSARQDTNGVFGIGEGVFEYVFVVDLHEHSASVWLLRFYGSYDISVITLPK